MHVNMSPAELLEELEFLFEKYSQELQATTQPYYLARIRGKVDGFEYDPSDILVRETLMEHVGSLPVVATTLYPFIDNKDVNLGEALVMLAIHDIGELVTGDVMTFVKKSDKEKREQKAALQILHASYHDSYQDVESQTSVTAKFAKSIDKITPDIFDCITPAEITIQRYKHYVGIEAGEIMGLLLKHKRPYMLWNPFLTELHEHMYDKLSKKLKAASL